MDPETAFLQAAIPDPVNILGQSLEPYSLAHEIFLRRLGSPFVFGQGAQLKGDELAQKLFPAAYVCCFRYPKMIEQFRAKDMPHLLGAWRTRLGRKINLREQAAEFTRYIDAGSQAPVINRRPIPPGSSKPGAPALLCYLVCLLKMGQPLDAAMNSPFGFARWLYFAHWESEGTCSIANKSEEDWMREEMRKAGMEPLTMDPNNLRRSRGV